MKKLPKAETVSDAAHALTRAVLSAIPAAGGPLQVLFESIFTAPLEKRRQAWLEELARSIHEIEAKVEEITPEALAANDVFISVTLQASQMAFRTHRKEKLEALRNAIINSALPTAPDEDQQFLFLRIIDQYSPGHLRILQFLNDPKLTLPLGRIVSSNLIEWLGQKFPELAESKELTGQLVRDLQLVGLVKKELSASTKHHFAQGGVRLHTAPSGTTDLGNEFLKFVSSPFS